MHFKDFMYLSFIANLESPINLIWMYLDSERRPEDQRKPTQAQVEH